MDGAAVETCDVGKGDQFRESMPSVVCLNAHLLARPDRGDPAVPKGVGYETEYLRSKRELRRSLRFLHCAFLFGCKWLGAATCTRSVVVDQKLR